MFVGGVKVSGYLWIFVLVGFGCWYVVLFVFEFSVGYFDVLVMFDLFDWMVDFVNEGFDCVVWFGELFDLLLVLLKFGENCCVCVVFFVYFVWCGMLVMFVELVWYNCLVLVVNVN